MDDMRLQVRAAGPADFPELERMILESFEPITWAKPLDERFGPLNGQDWRARWRRRLEKVFAEQIVLAGFCGGGLAAAVTATIDEPSALAYIDILAVARSAQGTGLGRAMLRAGMAELRERGAQYVNLDCLDTNEPGNALYRSEGFEQVACHLRWFRKL
jgi:ribosomal protein S18 acetylase RimI-like enzyme